MIAYRRDIDGLRAIAVLLVIFYHVGFDLFSGGFIGVDIFFVISGFLITSIINSKISKGDFSLKKFYLKRIRRIYPLLLFVIFITYIVASLILLPKEFMQLIYSGGLAFLSISNFYFNNITGGYFDSSADIMPLLHTWSLAVEEQFYLLWPMLLLLITKLGNKKYSGYYILLLTIVLIPVSQYLASSSPNSAYYLIPARGFELLMGATLALLWDKLPTLNRTASHWLSCIALLGLIFIGITLEKGDIFPGYNAAIVCLFTCVIIYTGKHYHHSGIANKLLSLKPIVFLGLISYSLYLWHWPIIAFCHYLLIEKTIFIKIAILSLTFALSLFSYFSIEYLFRFKYRLSLKKSITYFFAIPLVFLILISALVATTRGLPKRFPDNIQTMLIAAGSGYYSPCKTDLCDDSYSNRMNTSIENANFLLLGDSHARAIQGFINVLANDANKNGLLIYKNGTPLVFNQRVFEYYSNDKTSNYNEMLTANTKILKQAIDDFNGETIILSNRYALYSKGRNEKSNLSNIMVNDSQAEIARTSLAFNGYFDGLKQTIDYILSKDKKIVIISSIPELGKNLSNCSILRSHIPLKRECNIDRKLINTRAKDIDIYLNQLGLSYPNNIEVIDLKSYLCDDKKCFSEIQTIPVYHDDNHLNYIGSKYLGKLYLSDHTNFFNEDS